MAKLELPVLAFVQDFCTQAFPNRDFTRGSAISDLVIKAFGTILQPLRQEIDTIKINQSCSNWQYMSQQAMDDLAANWGKFRQTGSQSTGVVRLYFETATAYQLNYMAFNSTDGVNFILAAPVTISAQALLQNRQSDGTYFYDVTVVSVGVGNKYACPAGTVTGMTNPPSGITRCTNLDDFTVTAPNESNFDVINSMYRNIGLGNLVSRQSIRSPLFQQFPGLLDIYVAKAGDPKLVRDRVTVQIDGEDVQISLGGMADVWCNTTGIVSRQVNFSYTPTSQTFKLVSDDEAANTTL